uniref:Cleavage/polyadenylation specificity factor A subunit N-terminal domain-containing protein n=1 Tax=Photinus pyralis TaxID=7054 RepID=A0A1Y1MIN7_PHOPY
MEKMHNAHYFSLSSQGNIYTVTILRLANNTNKLLVASLRREIIYFEYLQGPTGILIPSTKEVSFTYLPKGAEIISMDAFNKSETANDFVIGITIIKVSTILASCGVYIMLSGPHLTGAISI